MHKLWIRCHWRNENISQPLKQLVVISSSRTIATDVHFQEVCWGRTIRLTRRTTLTSPNQQARKVWPCVCAIYKLCLFLSLKNYLRCLLLARESPCQLKYAPPFPQPWTEPFGLPAWVTLALQSRMSSRARIEQKKIVTLRWSFSVFFMVIHVSTMSFTPPTMSLLVQFYQVSFYCYFWQICGRTNMAGQTHKT